MCAIAHYIYVFALSRVQRMLLEMARRKKRALGWRVADEIMHGMREIAQAIEDGVPFEQRFTVRTVSVRKPRYRKNNSAVKPK